MPTWLIVVLVLAMFFLWAGYRLRGRGHDGPGVRDERHRSTHGGDAIGSG